MRGLLDRGLKIRPLTLPDRFIDHDTPEKQYDEAGLTRRTSWRPRWRRWASSRPSRY